MFRGINGIETGDNSNPTLQESLFPFTTRLHQNNIESIGQFLTSLFSSPFSGEIGNNNSLSTSVALFDCDPISMSPNLEAAEGNVSCKRTH